MKFKKNKEEKQIHPVDDDKSMVINNQVTCNLAEIELNDSINTHYQKELSSITDMLLKGFIDLIRGNLKLVDAKNNIFELHDIRGRDVHAICEFTEDTIAEAKDAIGKEISVYGRCFYELDGIFPHTITNIEKVGILIDDKDDPNGLYLLRTIEENIIGERTPVEWKEHVDKFMSMDNL